MKKIFLCICVFLSTLAFAQTTYNLIGYGPTFPSGTFTRNDTFEYTFRILNSSGPAPNGVLPTGLDYNDYIRIRTRVWPLVCGSANHYDITPILNSPYDTAAVYIPLDSFSPPITLKIPVSPINGNVVYGWVMGHIQFTDSLNQILQDSITDFEFTVQNTACHSYFEIYPTSTSGLYSGINMSTGNNLIYHWEFGDGDTSNLPYPTHLYANPGHYCVSLTVKNAVCCDRYWVCDSFSFKTDAGPMIQLVITGPTGLTETETESRTIVFPNPATNQLTINLSGLQAEQVSIYNVDGKLVSTTQQPANNTVDVTELAKGVYVAEVKVKDAVQRVRWVKM